MTTRSNWREIGDVTPAIWSATLRGTPLFVEQAALYAAARPHTGLCLSQMGVESEHGTSALARATKNILGQRPRPGDDGPATSDPFRVFDSYTECVRYWHGKVTDPEYAYADTTSLEEFIHVYAPASDGNNEEAYVARIRADLARWGLTDQTEAPVGEIIFGRVPHPPVDIRDIPSSVNIAWNDLGPRTIRGIVWHRSLGTHNGNDEWYRNGGRTKALTDYGVGVQAQDGAALAGDLRRWNDPRGKRSPWANGSLSAPYGDGLAFFNRYGVDGINRDLTSIEISGFQGTPLDERSREMIAALTAYWADQYRVPWDEWPMVPGEDRSFVLWHEELTIGSGKRCPFDVVKAETAALIERTRAILKRHQTSAIPGPKPPVYAPPIVPAFLTADLARGYPSDQTVDGVTYFAALRPYEAIKPANRLQGPDIRGPKVGPRLRVRERFRGMYTVKVEGRSYVVTPYASYIDAGALTPRVSVRAA